MGRTKSNIQDVFYLDSFRPSLQSHNRGKHTRHFFVLTTNDVTIHYYFFRPHLFFVQALLLCFQMYLFLPYNTFFKFRQRHVFQFCFKCILFEKKTISKPNLAQNGKYACLTYFSSGAHPFLLFSYFTPKLQLLGDSPWAF